MGSMLGCFLNASGCALCQDPGCVRTRTSVRVVLMRAWGAGEWSLVLSIPFRCGHFLWPRKWVAAIGSQPSPCLTEQGDRCLWPVTTGLCLPPGDPSSGPGDRRVLYKELCACALVSNTVTLPQSPSFEQPCPAWPPGRTWEPRVLSLIKQLCLGMSRVSGGLGGRGSRAGSIRGPCYTSLGT